MGGLSFSVLGSLLDPGGSWLTVGKSGRDLTLSRFSSSARWYMLAGGGM